MDDILCKIIILPHMDWNEDPERGFWLSHFARILMTGCTFSQKTSEYALIRLGLICKTCLPELPVTMNYNSPMKEKARVGSAGLVSARSVPWACVCAWSWPSIWGRLMAGARLLALTTPFPYLMHSHLSLICPSASQTGSAHPVEGVLVILDHRKVSSEQSLWVSPSCWVYTAEHNRCGPVLRQLTV